MYWKKVSNYFMRYPEGAVGKLFEEATYPWSPLEGLKGAIERYFQGNSASGEISAEKFVRYNGSHLIEGNYTFTQCNLLEEDFIDPELKIWIESGTLIEQGATIKNHTVIKKSCEVRQGAYIRGNCYIGEESVIGHTTEMKNTIFVKHVEAGHFAYLGDSIIGAYVNLGAGTKLSNLQFRSLTEKKEGTFPEIPFRVQGENIQTKVFKLGAIIGDGCETGCNAVLSPFVILEPEVWIMPNLSVLKGVYKRRSILRNIVDCKKRRI